MTLDQTSILAILAAAVALFLWGRWRHDVVALAALLASVLAGLVPRPDAFAGFGHPAVVTVACVLILSRGLQTSGAIDAVTHRLIPAAGGPTLTIGALTGLGTLLSAFMNNVGALALLMPVAIQVAGKLELPPGRILMPLAFGSILGGMTTLIGTPPNLIVSGFRASTGVGSFAMFDFTPAGLAVAAAGFLFIVLVGWRLVPSRERAGVKEFETGSYLTEARVNEDSKANGRTIHEIGRMLDEADAQVVGLIRNDVHLGTPSPGRVLRSDDILILEAEPASLANAVSALGLKLVEDVPAAPPSAPDGGEQASADAKATDAEPKEKKAAPRKGDDNDVTLTELAVLPASSAIGRSATDLQLRTRFGVNLLALSRQGRRTVRRLRSDRIQAGDVLLLQGTSASVMAFANSFGCVPLAERAVRIPNPRQAILATVIMGCAVAGAAFGLLPAAIAFAAGALAAVATRVVSPRTVYESIDWSVIVLLAALIPVADAMATTGAADVIARGLLDTVARGHAVIGLALILVVTMTLSDFMNNAATAAVMCPIAISTSAQLNARPDPFLMAVAIGASCAFLTPIGHQNNTLILGPGGFRFGDYWRLGLPLEVLVVTISLPVLLHVWPL